MTGQQWSSPPEMTIDPQKGYVATLETDRGTACEASACAVPGRSGVERRAASLRRHVSGPAARMERLIA